MSSPVADSWKEALKLYGNIASQAIQFYPHLAQASVELLNYSENATYLVRKPSADGEEKYILRVNKPGYHTKEEIAGELAWLKTIRDLSRFEVAMPIAGKNGEYIQTVNLPNDPRDYYCILFTFLDGEAPDENKEGELIPQFETLGEITAHLHEHSIRNHVRFASIKRLTWDYENILGEKPKWGRWQDGKGITPERRELFERVSQTIQKRLEKFGKDPTRFGLIHSDLRLANLLISGQQIKVIDFDDCGFGWYLYDLATALSFIEHKPYVPALVQSWLKGYRKVRPLSEEEEREIPTFIMMRRLQLIAWIGSRENETALQLGEKYSEDSDLLARNYLLDMQES